MLPSNVARCNDKSCKDRERCLRYLERDTSGSTIFPIQAGSLRPRWIDHQSECPKQIEPL